MVIGAIAAAAAAGMKSAMKFDALLQGVVESVNEGMMVARVSFPGDTTVREVALSVTKEATSYFVPSVGSRVAVAYMEHKENRGVIVGWEKIDRMVLMPGSEIFMELSNGKFKLTNSGIDLGEGTSPMLLGDKVQEWAQSVDQALAALLQWATTGVAPGPTGGIAPLTGIEGSAFPDDALSQENKVS